MYEKANKKGQSRPDIGGWGRELDDTDKTVVLLIPKSKKEQDETMSVWQTANVDSSATAHMVVDPFVLSMYKNPSIGSIGTASDEVVQAKKEGPFEV